MVLAVPSTAMVALYSILLQPDIVICFQENLSEDLLNQPINLSMPNLKQVEMKNYEGSENELQFLKLLTEQGVVLQKIVVIHTQVGEVLFPPVVLTRRVQAGEILQGPPHFEVLVNRLENQHLL